MVNLKSASFILIMLLNQSVTRVHSKKDPRLHFGESFTFKDKHNFILFYFVYMWQTLPPF